MLTVKQAAKEIGVGESRVRQFIYGGRLEAQKFGRDLLITKKEVERFAKIRRKTGAAGHGVKNG